MLLFSVQFIITLTCVFMAVGFFSLFERKSLGATQLRKGPNKVSFGGTLQPIGDAIKLLSKQNPSPHSSNKILYLISPPILLASLLAVWVTPWNNNLISSESGVLFILIILSVSSFGPILSGWASNSKFSLIGAMRAIAQALSFEIIFSVSLVSFCLLTSSLEVGGDGKSALSGLVSPVMSLSLFLSTLAESGRSPYDLTEAESELVSGYTVDYGGSLYKIIFLMENISSIFSSCLINLLCFPPLSWLKCMIILFLIIWLRASLPRVRYDWMMSTCWTQLVPTSISLFLIAAILSYMS